MQGGVHRSPFRGLPSWGVRSRRVLGLALQDISLPAAYRGSGGRRPVSGSATAVSLGSGPGEAVRTWF